MSDKRKVVDAPVGTMWHLDDRFTSALGDLCLYPAGTEVGANARPMLGGRAVYPLVFVRVIRSKDLLKASREAVRRYGKGLSVESDRVLVVQQLFNLLGDNRALGQADQKELPMTRQIKRNCQ